MDATIVLVRRLCVELLSDLGHRDDPQCKVTDAEVMTIGLVAALFFAGNQALANRCLAEQGYIGYQLSRSRLCRRMARVSHYFELLFDRLATHFKAHNNDHIYAVDSMPIAVCDWVRVHRSRIYPLKDHPSQTTSQKARRRPRVRKATTESQQGDSGNNKAKQDRAKQDEPRRGGEYLGYVASKRRYYYGIKLNLLVTEVGFPVEFKLTPGRYNDITSMRWFALDLEPGATVYADKGYVSSDFEEECAEYGIQFCPMRRSTDSKQDPAWQRYLNHVKRKAVERTFSAIERIMPRHLHAVSARGFETKIVLLVLAVSIRCFERLLA